MAITRLSRTGWSITADSTFDTPYVATKAIDSNSTTFWISGSGFPHYITVDMGSAQTFSAVEFAPRSDGTRNDPAQVAVYVSDDGTTWGSPVVTDTWFSSAATQYLEFAPVTKRYFRFQGNTGANNAFLACTEIYAGEPIPPFVRLPRTGWSVTADSVFDTPYVAAKAIDSNSTTFWISASGFPHYLTVDMGSAQTFNGIQFVPRSDGSLNNPLQVAVYVSDDGTTWGSPVATATWTSDATTKILSFASVTKRWFRFQGNTGVNAFLGCTEIYAGVGASPPAGVVQTQELLEHADLPVPALWETQAVLEVAHAVAAQTILETQAALEHVKFPPNAIWATQVCLEVLFPYVPPTPTGLRNYAYTGGWART